LLDASGKPIEKAQVFFGALAHANGAQPTWDGQTCSNVYCHGATLNDSAALSTQPKWSGQSACGSCHGIPPSSHTLTSCVSCHPRVVDASGKISSPALHVDGNVSVGDDSGTCNACHATLSGAHTSHLQATHRLRPPLACTDCHALPAEVDSPGHIDHATVQVFPDGTSPLARADGANPTFDVSAGTCTNVYCHGSGAHLEGDAATTIVRAPSWSATNVAECGKCHGVPPIDAAHATSHSLADCHTCHPTTIDATGGLLVGATSTHMNGVIDGP
jgi:predicted CxxxxCH...CXXCH cytochrome family protein